LREANVVHRAPRTISVIGATDFKGLWFVEPELREPTKCAIDAERMAKNVIIGMN
jgi:hypothetical protein